MVLVRASCRDCGDVEITSRSIKIMRCAETDAATYIFTCPICRMLEFRLAEAHVVDILLTAGSSEHIWHLPPELMHPVAHVGDPISENEILDLTALLRKNSDDAILTEVERLTGLGPNS